MKAYLSLIKFSHTIFALPFALVGFFLSAQATGTAFSLRLFILVLLCMIFARSAAMAFNRYLDRDIDKLNARTAVREIPAGVIKPQSALIFVLGNCMAFIATTWFINPLCFALSPVALLVVLGYSYTKRFTFLCHFVLGAGLGLAPLGAYLAGGGGFDLIPLLLSFGVMCWVAGFDIIYALQDADFDKDHKLYSIPSTVGVEKALRISNWTHAASAIFMISATWFMTSNYANYGLLSWIAMGAFLLMLIYQHMLVKPNDLSRINLAFFTTNGIASVVFGSLVILDGLV